MSHNVDVNSDENDNGDKGDVRIENVEDREDATNEEDRRIVGLVSDEINVLDFGSEEHAFIFYREYARSHGFVVRKYDVSQNVAGNINKCQFICNKEVSKFVETHNHHLTPVNHVHHMPEYQVLFDLDKAQVDSLHSFGSRTCQIMGYLLAKKGGYGSIRSLKNDLHNHKKKIGLSDLEGKSNNDPTFYSIIEITIDANRIFNVFGDVFAFDTIYKRLN
ncbi:Protein FAR1-RELATED SEQUENCE 5 [Glycine soja]